MKVLIAGLGSIGQRHARNLRAQFGDAVDLLAFRVRGVSPVIREDMSVDAATTVEAAYGIRSFDSLDRALAERPDVAFICNPTSLHLPVALAAAAAGCHLFIEKPLSSSLDNVNALIDVVERQGLTATVGYQLRFHPGLLRARALLCQGAIGRVLSARAEFGEYLPDAHPYEDYRTSYAARAELGGGVIGCFIHEVDYLCWLFGQPTGVFTTGGRLGDLEIDVEDTALSSLEFRSAGHVLPVQLHLSFAQRQPSRTCTIHGEAGTLHLDLLAPALAVTSARLATRETFDVGRNQLFAGELAHFFTAIAHGTAPAVSLRDAAASLAVAAAMRESLASRRVVEVRQ